MEDLVEQVLSSRRELVSRRGFGFGLAAAVLLHAGLMITLVAVPEKPAPPPLEYVAVQAVPPAALGAPKPRLAQPPPPPKKAPEPAPEPEPIPPKAPVLPTPKPKPEPPKTTAKPDDSKKPVKPAPAQAAGSAAPETPAPPADQREGAPGGAAAATAAFGSTRLEGIDPDFTYDYYLDRMLALIHGQWQRPTTDGEVRAVLRFTVQKNGEITDLELETPSGSNAFDLASLRAVQNAGPLPPLPSSYRRGLLTVTLIVR